jgi:hypothetical protein
MKPHQLFKVTKEQRLTSKWEQLGLIKQEFIPENNQQDYDNLSPISLDHPS